MTYCQSTTPYTPLIPCNETDQKRLSTKYHPLEAAGEPMTDAQLRKVVLGVFLIASALFLAPALLGHALLGGFGIGIACLIKTIGVVKVGFLTAIPTTAAVIFGLQITGAYDAITK